MRFTKYSIISKIWNFFRRKNLLFLSIYLPVLLVAGCGSEIDVAHIDQDRVPKINFSTEEKRIAKKLSVSAKPLVKSDSRAFDAVACQKALDTLEDISSRNNLLTAEQEKAFKLAKAFYKEQEIAVSVSTLELKNVRSDVEVAFPDEGSRVRLAMSCLRGLT